MYGIREGSAGGTGENQYKELETNNFTQADLANELGMTRQTLQNYKKLTEMIPELEELVDTGICTQTTATYQKSKYLFCRFLLPPTLYMRVFSGRF